MSISREEKYFANKSYIPEVTPNMVKHISPYRKERLSEEVEAGLFRDGSSNYKRITSHLGNAVPGITKLGQVSSPGGGFRGSNDSLKQIPEIYSPLWLNSNLSLPRDRITINAWSRAFDALNPYVHNAMNLHSTYPISKLNIKCADKKVEQFFGDMIDEIDLLNVCIQIAKEYWLLGECFPYLEFNPNLGKWSRVVIQNPDYVVVQRGVGENIIMLKPDEHLKKIVMSNSPMYIAQRKQLNPYIIEAVKRGQNIQLDSMSISHLVRKITPYESRGTGLPVPIFRSLMLFDQLRESKYVQASTMINPMLLVKIGSAEHKATPEELDAYRNQFEQAYADRNFKLFTHNDVEVTPVGYGSGIYDISGDITQLIKEILVGLMVPSVVMGDGSDITYANGAVAVDVLRQRYMQFRNMMANWLRIKVFAPICEVQGFYRNVDGRKILNIPQILWNHMSLFDTNDYITQLSQLSQEGDGKRVSTQTLYRSLGLDYKDEIDRIREEAIQSEILKKEKAALTTMDLNALRTLSDDSEIKEPTEEEKENVATTVPGEVPGGSNPIETAPTLPGMSEVPPPPS